MTPSIRDLSIAFPLSVLFVAAPLFAAAQGVNEHPYIAQLIGLISEQDEKVVIESMNDWDAIQWSDVSRAAHQVKFTASRPVDDGEFTAHLAGTGVALFWLAEVQPDGSLAGSSYEAHVFPVYMDTGDPVGDNAQYDADKTAWLAAHPGWVDVNTRVPEDEGTEAEGIK